MSTETGKRAEDVAARHLGTLGYQVLEQNWKTSWCEIDIVAKKHQTISFCEVKYRKTTAQGHGLDYITPAKVVQMERAAEGWVQAHNWSGDYQLCAVEVSGEQYQITAFLEL